MAKYHGYAEKMRFKLDGLDVTEEENPELFARVITEGLVQACFELQKAGKLGPEYDCLRGWEYVPPEER